MTGMGGDNPSPHDHMDIAQVLRYILCLQHVVFGRVLFGMDVIRQLQELPVDEKHRPKASVCIADCGRAAVSRVVNDKDEGVEL